MVKPLTWKRLVWQLVFFYLPFIIIGTIFNNTLLLLLLASLGLLGFQLYYQLQLANWLWNKKRLVPPSGHGYWEGIFNGLFRLQLRQRKRRKELADVIRRFRHAAESLPDAVVVFRQEGRIVWCNKLAQELLDFKWPQDSGQPIFNLLRHPSFIHYLQQRDFSTPLEIPSPLYAERALELRIVPHTESEHLMLVRDITQLKQLEGMRRNFFANVSHELRTPMTVLQGYLEMTQDPDVLVGPIWERAHTVMTEQLDRMNSLVTQLLTLSKIEAAPIHELNTVINVPHMLRALEREANSLSAELKHNLYFEIDNDLMVLADEEQLRSAISNLIYNAVKYVPAGSNIYVRWYQTEQGACLEVEDNGEGIAPQHIHRLTERFYRVDKARSRDTGGSGLGLSIVKHALTHHHSHLVISSAIGVGSKFSFVLPDKLVVRK